MKYATGSKCLLKNKKNSGFSEWRIYSLFFFFLAVAAVIFTRLYFLQVISFESYRALAEGQHTFFKKLNPVRGEIFFKNKNSLRDSLGLEGAERDVYPAAINRDSKMAYSVPKEIEDRERAASEVANALGIDRNYLLEKFKKSEDGYEPIKRRLNDDEVEKLAKLDLEGIHLAEESYRYYPSGKLAANILGFVGWKNDDFGGRYGLESYFEKQLGGEEGKIIHDRDASGRKIFLGTSEIAEAKNGDNFVLTIDYAIQYETERMLESAIEKYEAEGGSIIVMEPETGKIISMANYPTFDPNEYSKVEDIDAYRNTAVSEPYEPGSIFKPFVMAAGIDNGKIYANAVYSDTGAVSEAGYIIKNSDLKSYGKQTMTEALEKSLNTGAIYVEKLLGNKNFSDYMERFGFGELTGVDLISESPGNINNLKNLKSDIQFFTASFGQGITATPMQLVSAYGAMANGGMLMKPQLVEKIIHSDGSEENVEPKAIRRVISEKAALEITGMLESVVVKGHGKRAGVPGYRVGGKTGTAQVASEEKRGYEEGKKVGSFAGFAPVLDPKFAMLVKIDNPKNVEWAESSAAPTFGELLKFILEYYNIEPTEKYEQVDMDKFAAEHKLKEFFMEKQREKEEKEKGEKEISGEEKDK